MADDLEEPMSDADRAASVIAFEALYDAEFDRCVRAARRILADHEAATAVASEAFTAAWARWRTLGKRKAAGWVLDTTVDKAIAHARNGVAPDGPSPDADDRRATHEALAEALRRLKPKQRAALTIRHLADAQPAPEATND